GHEAEVVVGDLDLAQVGCADRPVGDLELVLAARAIVGDAEAVARVARLGPVYVLAVLCLRGCHRVPLSRCSSSLPNCAPSGPAMRAVARSARARSGSVS